MSVSIRVRGRQIRRCLAILAALAVAGPGQAGAKKAASLDDKCVDRPKISQAAVVGIDVSKWQGHIRFERFPQHIRYVFVRATRGAKMTDAPMVATVRLRASPDTLFAAIINRTLRLSSCAPSFASDSVDVSIPCGCPWKSITG